MSHSRTKRTVDGAFSLCGSREDLVAIAHQILGAMEAARVEAYNEGHDRYFSYGWIDILPVGPPASIATSQPPVPWDTP